MNFKPFYLKPNVPYEEADKCSLYDIAGKSTSLEQLNIQISFLPNGKGNIKLLDLEDDINFTPRLWEVAQETQTCIKVNMNDDGKLWISRQKLHLKQTGSNVVQFDDEPEAADFNLDEATIAIETIKLINVKFDPRLFEPIHTGSYLDQFWSRKIGLLPATNVMITGDPGIGKSSNLMDILVRVHKTEPEKRLLYVSSEMGRVDMEEFLQFYPGLENIDFLFLGEYLTDPNSKFKPYQALQATLEKGWDLVVLDSLYETQSLIQEDLDITSFKKGERWMLDLMSKHNQGFNKTNLFTTFLIIQQKNKSGQYVGSKRLEHMTTAFLQLLWDAKERGKRYMIFEKNRKGKEKVKLYYNLDPIKGIVYDEVRHKKELEFIEMIQQNNGMGLEELSELDFDKVFRDKIPDAAHSVAVTIEE